MVAEANLAVPERLMFEVFARCFEVIFINIARASWNSIIEVKLIRTVI